MIALWEEPMVAVLGGEVHRLAATELHPRCDISSLGSVPVW